jgi:hypothetical protein
MGIETGVLMQGTRVLDGRRGGERIDQMLRVRAIEDLPTYRAILERHYEQLDAIDGEPFIEAEKQRRRALVLDETNAALAKDLESRIADREREFAQLEGQARADARGHDWAKATDEAIRREQGLTAEWNLRMTGIAGETDITTLNTLVADAELSGNPRINRAVLDAITKQTARLAAIERETTKGGPAGPVELAHRAIEQKFKAWRQQNPTPAERLREVSHARERMRMDLERSAALYKQFFAIG